MADENVMMNSKSLKDFANELEKFKRNIEQRCNSMENGINSCSRYMQDETSKELLKKSQATINEIKDCLYPTELILAHIYRIIDIEWKK